MTACGLLPLTACCPSRLAATRGLKVTCQVFGMIEGAGLRPDVVAYASLITALHRGAQARRPARVISQGSSAAP